MDISEIANAIAYLSEEINSLRIEQKEHNQATGENLRQWSQINASLMECLDRQSEEYQGSASILQVLAQHLLQLAQTTQQLTISTTGLEVSSGKLTLHLEEKQAPQLQQLEDNNKQLQASSQKLEQYLITEQSKRLSLLENGLKSLLQMIQTSQEKNLSLIASTSPMSDPIPLSPTEKQSAQNIQKSQNSDLVSLVSTVVLSSLCTTCLLLSLWQFGGVGSDIARSSERTEWNLIKLERIESALGLK